MSFSLEKNHSLTREQAYITLIPQIKNLVQGENDFIANLANITGALYEYFHFLWIGFYRVKGEELVLGPFQGPVACTRIKKGKGVCGKCWETGSSILVKDVSLFDGHIACSSLSQSEIVVPYFFPGSSKVAGVLDIDSDTLAAFDNVDKKYLEEIAAIVSNCLTTAHD